MEWISNKLQVATDGSYNDPTNLTNKMQRHQAFEAELTANKRRMDAVVTEGNGLIQNGHYAKRDIKTRLTGLEDAWQNLVESSQDKNVKLQQAYQVRSACHRLRVDAYVHVHYIYVICTCMYRYIIRSLVY